MITLVEIPKLTLTMDSATLVKWLKQEGEAVERDESLFELETDKTVVEVPSPGRGLLRKILVRDGVVEGGKPVALLGDVSDPLPDAPINEGSKSGGIQVSALTSPSSRAAEAGSLRATPA